MNWQNDNGSGWRDETKGRGKETPWVILGCNGWEVDATEDDAQVAGGVAVGIKTDNWIRDGQTDIDKILGAINEEKAIC